MQLPQDFVSQMKAIIPDYAEFVRAMDEEPKKAFWLNKHKINCNDWEKINPYQSRPTARVGSYYFGEDKIGLHPYFLAGLVYSQDPSAQMVCSYLPDLDGKIVVDMCASPGGKTCMLAQNNCLVISNEYVQKRVSILRSNVERLGLGNVCITNMDSKALSDKLLGASYLTLVDAPCSGEGMFRKDPDTIHEWSLSCVQANARRQLEILSNASLSVANGGYLIYSTCTYSITENEAVIVEFIKKHSDFHIVPLDSRVQDVSRECIVIDKKYPTSLARRFMIQDGFGEGQFVCMMKRSGEYVDRKYKDYGFNKLSRSELAIVKEFLSSNTTLNNYDIQKVGNNISVLPHITYPLTESGIVSCGVTIGQIERDRFVPHHNLATSFGDKMKNILHLSIDDIRVQKYLFGEQIEGDIPNGYCCIMIDNFPLGLGKATSGRINNLYPKGLRTMIKK